MATIIIKNSTGSGVIPSSLQQGELAINTKDGKLFYGSGSGNIVKEFTGSGGGGGSTFPFTGSAIISGSLNIIGTTTITGSLIVSGSSTFTNIGPAIFSGSVNSQGGFTGSLQGTASYATQALTASFALTSAGGGAAFPFTGSALITGSLGVTGSTSIRGTFNQGSASLASGLFSHVQGFNTTASGIYSHAEGQNTLASGQYSHAEGVGDTTALDFWNRATGTGSHAEGNITLAEGNYSHAEGQGYYLPDGEGGYEYYPTYAIGVGSHAEGFGTRATGNYSHAEGYTSNANNNYSHAEGDDTVTNGIGSHAEGQDTTTNGQYSHAEGVSTVTAAAATGSHAEGYFTQANGQGSHAEGSSSIAIGIGSHAEGFNTVASGSFQHVQGQYNISSSAQSAFIIGNGTSDAARSNLVFASGSQFQITGSLDVSGSITGSLFGTASWATNALTASTAPNAALIIFGNYAGAGGGFTNPIVTHLPFGTTTVSANETQRQIVTPQAGTLKNIYIRTNGAAVATSFTTFTIKVNGVATNVKINISGGQAAGLYSNIINSASVVLGDEISLQVSTSIANGPTVNQYSFGIFNT